MITHGKFLKLKEPFAKRQRTWSLSFDELWLESLALGVDMHQLQMMKRYILIVDRMKLLLKTFVILDLHEDGNIILLTVKYRHCTEHNVS